MNAVFSKNREIGSFVLIGAGCLLIATGILHVTITSLLYHWFSLFVPRGLHIVGPPFLLNHLIVGVLLVSTGLTTIVGALGVRKGDALSWTVVAVNTVAVVFLPLLLVILMRGPYYNAPAFKVAEVLVWLSALIMIIATTLVRPRPAVKQARARVLTGNISERV